MERVFCVIQVSYKYFGGTGGGGARFRLGSGCLNMRHATCDMHHTREGGGVTLYCVWRCRSLGRRHTGYRFGRLAAAAQPSIRSACHH